VQSALEKDILTISRFLSGIAVVIALGLSVALYFFANEPFLEIVRLDLTLLIAGIPVALPVVMSLIISVGVVRLSESAAIVRRLAALEDLANVDMLLSDKTGTLTKNEIKVHETVLFGEYTERIASGLASATAVQSEHRTLERAITEYAKHCSAPMYAISEFVPADSIRKRSTVLAAVDGTAARITLGAPQVVETLLKLDEDTRNRFERAVADAGTRGFRVLALAMRSGPKDSKPEEKDMKLIALFLLSDTLRSDAAGVISFLTHNGVRVKMLTGDNVAVASEVGKRLGLTGEIMHCLSLIHI